jgi:hypothetical protein
VAQTADNVRVAVTGAVYYGPAGTALPTNATTSLNAAFEELGYVDDNGLTQTIDESTTRIQAWQNGDTVRTVQDSHALTYQFACLETNDQVLDAYYGNYVNGTVEVRADAETRGEWVFHIIDGGDLIRIVVPDGQVTDRGDISYVNGDAIKYPLTIECYPDADGVKAYLYLLGAGS